MSPQTVIARSEATWRSRAAAFPFIAGSLRLALDDYSVSAKSSPALAGIVAVMRPARSGPFALPHDRRAVAVGVEAVDVDPVRADHPVDMNHALVAAPRRDLLGAQRLAVDEAFGIALA